MTCGDTADGKLSVVLKQLKTFFFNLIAIDNYKIHYVLVRILCYLYYYYYIICFLSIVCSIKRIFAVVSS